MRGSLEFFARTDPLFGSIPASAGEPIAAVVTAPSARVYPRECGGAVRIDQCTAAISGLSPRVRGSLRSKSKGGAMSRSIPASAGEPCGCMPVQSQNAVYPRECGGASGNSGYGRYAVGLSPRVRGSHVSWSRMLAEIRSIPASAGEPGGSRRAASRTWVYPRECGGAYMENSPLTLLKGLSPRVRGSLEDRMRLILEIGSIPASAGEP